MKVDLHVHSCFSKRPSTWLLKKIGCAESYTQPRELLRIARQRGMTAFTITDHNTIDGGLEIADQPNVFMGCEVTSYFPEDHCKIHVLIYRFTEQQWREVDQLRENVFEMVRYLNEQNITYVLAHPFFAPNDRMTLDHFEQCVLLFNRWELNGDQDERVNLMVRRIAEALTPELIDRLADRHDLTPTGPTPWKKVFLGGSDDHSSLHIARNYTKVSGAKSIDEFWAGIDNGLGYVSYDQAATPMTMAHTVYGVAYQFYTTKVKMARYYENNVLMRFLDRMLQSAERKPPRWINRLYYRWKRRVNSPPRPGRLNLMEVVNYEGQKLITEDPQLCQVLDKGQLSPEEQDAHWFRFVNHSSNRILVHLANYIVNHLSGVNPFDIFHTLGSAGALYTLIAPYFVAYTIYSKCRRLSESIGAEFGINHLGGRFSELPAGPRVGLFTDTLNEINGVALTLRNQARMAEETDKAFTVMTCKKDAAATDPPPGVHYFEPIGVIDTPEYPEQKNYIPPLLEMCSYCYSRNFTHIHGSTPGPLGLAALAVARMMKLPFYATYHTAVPQYAGYLTDDASVEDLMWRYIIWFYEQADIIFSPSLATSQELIERGIDPAKLRIMPRGVNTDRFHPDTHDPTLELPAGRKLLYVGRVSKEKNMPLLERAFKQLLKTHPDVQLVIAGDGPYLDTMKRNMKGTPVVFTGYLRGDSLPPVYPLCDVFVFPSTTDTFGNVVLEAQASGVPVIVTDKGGPCENLIPGRTGLIVRGNDEAAFVHAMDQLLSNPDRLHSMRTHARQYALTRSLDKSFEHYWQFYTNPDYTPDTQPSIVDTTDTPAAVDNTTDNTHTNPHAHPTPIDEFTDQPTTPAHQTTFQLS